MSGKKKHKSANDYLSYLKGELSGRERYAFEKDLEADPFEQEAMEGLETLQEKQAEQDILGLHNRLRKRISRRRRIAIYSVAATVASLLIVGSVFLNIQDFNPLADEKQFYPEDSYDHPAPSEAQALPPDREEVTATEPVLPTPEKTPETPQLVEPDVVETYDFAMAEEEKVETEVSMMAAPTPIIEDLEEDPISHVEAEPVTRKKSMAQPVAQAPRDEISTRLEPEAEVAGMLTGQVSGIVISAEDQGPIPGAVVENRALKSGVFTDLDGRFDIAVQEDTPSTLVASFIGMETQEYSVKEGTVVELVLQPDPIALEEVVVVGYVSQQEKSSISARQVVVSEYKEEPADYSLAEPTIGYKKYKKYIEANIQFPVDDTDTQKAVVVLKFKITRSGEISDVSALRSPGELFSAEAIRLLMEGPSWKPAGNEDEAIDEWVRMRIVFKR